MIVLIAGCGDLGTEVGLRLAAAGHRVAGLRRSPQMLPADFVGVAADLTRPLPDLPDLHDLLGDVEVVVFAQAAGERTEAAYRATYVDGQRHVLDALDHAGARPRKVLLVSSTAVYGASDGSDVDETTPTRPTSTTGGVLVDAERALWERVPDAIVLRLAGLYGPGRTRLVDEVRSGEAVLPDPPVTTNRIHRDDAARAVIHLLSAVTGPASIYLGVDHAPVDRGEVLRFIADELGVPRPPAGPASRSRGGDKRCRNDRLVATGFEFTYPTYREGYRALLAGIGVRHP